MLNITECSVGAIIKLSAYQPLTITSTSNTACPTSSIFCLYLSSTVECNGLMIFPDDSLDVHVTSLNSDCSVCNRDGLRISATLSATFTSGERFDIILNLRDNSIDPSQYLHNAHILPAYTMQYNSFEFCATGPGHEPQCATDKGVAAISVAGKTFDVAIKQVFPRALTPAEKQKYSFDGNVNSIVLDDGRVSKGIGYNCIGWSVAQIRYISTTGIYEQYYIAQGYKQKNLLDPDSIVDLYTVTGWTVDGHEIDETAHASRMYTSSNFYSSGGAKFRWTSKMGQGEASSEMLLTHPRTALVGKPYGSIEYSLSNQVLAVESVFTRPPNFALATKVSNFIENKTRFVSSILKKKFISLYDMWVKSFSVKGTAELYSCSKSNECVALISLGSETIPLYMYKFLKGDMHAIFPYEGLQSSVGNANLIARDIPSLSLRAFKTAELWFEYETSIRYTPSTQVPRFFVDRNCTSSNKYLVSFSLFDRVPCNFKTELSQGRFVLPLLALASDIGEQSQICNLFFNTTSSYKLGISYTHVVKASQQVSTCSHLHVKDYATSGFASSAFSSIPNITQAQIKIMSFNVSGLSTPSTMNGWCASFDTLPSQSKSSQYFELEQNILQDRGLAVGGTYYVLESKDTSTIPFVIYHNKSGAFFLSKYYDTGYQLEPLFKLCDSMCSTALCIAGESSKLLDIS
jgi:hypothetical protein